jgi:hypothetical protein
LGPQEADEEIKTLVEESRRLRVAVSERDRAIVAADARESRLRSDIERVEADRDTFQRKWRQMCIRHREFRNLATYWIPL